MAEQTPTEARQSGQPDAPAQHSQPGRATQKIMVYNANDDLVDITAARQPELVHSVISEACLRGLGQREEPTEMEVFLDPESIYPIKPIGIVELAVVLPENSKFAWLPVFVVVRGLSADIVFGKDDCEIAAVRRPKELLPILATKKAKEEEKEREPTKRKADEKMLREAAEKRDAKKRKNDELRKGGGPAKDADGQAKAA